MITFHSVSWRNFLSTGNVPNSIRLDQNPATLIIGKNGCGKSTVLDALTFGLFGKPFRNINKPNLINSINNKNCYVEVEFSAAGKQYKVSRGIKPGIFEIICDGELVNKDAALKDYQKVLEQQILRLNYKTFTQVVILGSASFVPFMQLIPGQRREVIEDILDIRVFSSMNTILKEKIAETKAELALIDSTLAVTKAKVDGQKSLIQTLETNKKDIVNNLKTKIDENTLEISNALTQISTFQQKVENLSVHSKKELNVRTDIEKGKELQTKYNSKIEACKHNISFFSKNDVCPSCTQTIQEQHRAGAIASLEEEVNQNQKHHNELQVVLQKFYDKLDEINKCNDQITELNASIFALNNTINLLTRKNFELTQEIEAANQNHGDIRDEKAKLKAMANEAIELVKRRNELLEEKSLQDSAYFLLKDTGIKTAIIKEYLPVMNKLINKYLAAMDFFVHFELDESFNEVIRSRHRDEFTYANFSEGEKKRIDIALLLAWRTIAKMKNSVNTNLLLLDEVLDSALDASGIDYFLSIMNDFDEKSNVFIISHRGDSVMERFEHTIKFEKRSDFSTICT
jgi:DNA repair exonuclease SbcCD ATPase subunit